MPTQITISGITGTSPYDIYVCDDPITTIIYVNTITTTPYTFVIPSILSDLTSYNLRVVDNNNCVSITNLIP